MRRLLTLLTLFGLTILPLTAKEKQKKPPLPLTVLDAKTVSIVIEQDAGRGLENPLANQTAQKDVEAAFLKWGRFQPTLSTLNADLIVVIRKGSGQFADATLSNPQSSGMPMGGQQGNQPGLTNRPPPTNEQTPNSRADMSNPEDSFLVFDGKTQTPLASPPIWRYLGAEGLRSHSVPAVDAFRKAVADTEKIAAAAKNP